MTALQPVACDAGPVIASGSAGADAALLGRAFRRRCGKAGGMEPVAVQSSALSSPPTLKKIAGGIKPATPTACQPN